MRPPLRIGRADFYLRRASGLVLVAFFAAYLVLLAREGRGIWLGDVGRSAGWAGRALELTLVALLTYHASSGLAQWALERLAPARHHTFAFVLSVALSSAAALAHLPSLYGWP
jgi:succinate dehydrogenase hydrophobic anchor subunit